jgi:predicted nucleic acid-binding protein
MGLVLDSSILIGAERAALPVSRLLADLDDQYAESEFLLSMVTVMELEHGWHRSKTPAVADKRRQFLDEVFAVIPAEPFTREIAMMAARIDAELRSRGRVIATADLMIGATAAHFGYSVATRNARHFSLIPDLPVLSL